MESLSDFLAVNIELNNAWTHGQPTLEQCEQRWPDIPANDLQERFAGVLADYDRLNEDLFRIFKPALDLSGPFKNTDAEMIKRKFAAPGMINSADGAPRRDGRGLGRWALEFGGTTNVTGQLALTRKLLSMKLSPNADLEQLTLHNSEMLSVWASVGGNRIDSPEPFYQIFMLSYPTEPSTAKIVLLRVWLVEKHAAKQREFSDPYELLGLIAAHAVAIGVPAGHGNASSSTALLIQTTSRRGKLVGKCGKCFLLNCKAEPVCCIYDKPKSYWDDWSNKKTAILQSTQRMVTKENLQSARHLDAATVLAYDNGWGDKKFAELERIKPTQYPPTKKKQLKGRKPSGSVQVVLDGDDLDLSSMLSSNARDLLHAVSRGRGIRIGLVYTVHTSMHTGLTSTGAEVAWDVGVAEAVPKGDLELAPKQA